MTVALVFAWGMALFPLVFLLWYLGRDEVRARLEEQGAGERVARSKRLAWMLTLGGVAVLAFLWLTNEPEDAAGPLCGAGFALFHFVWWFACAPLLNRAEAPQPIAVTGTPTADGAVRSASLTAREETDYLPLWWWIVPVGALGVGTAWMCWRIFFVNPPSTGTWIMAMTAPLAALTFLIGYGWWARRTATGPQDVSGAADPVAYEAALDDFRRFMARGIFWLMTAAVVLFVGTGVAIVATQGDAEAHAMIGGWVGGGGGSLVGILGGVFGTLCSLKRMRLERIRRGDAPTGNGVPA